MKWLLIFLGCCCLLSADDNKIGDPQQEAKALVDFLHYRYPYSVTVKLSLLSDPLKVDGEGIKAVLITQELVADMCYLKYLSEKKGGDYSREVFWQLAVGFRDEFIDRRDFFKKGEKMKLISPSGSSAPWIVEPFEYLQNIEIPIEKEKELRAWFKRNWKKPLRPIIPKD